MSTTSGVQGPRIVSSAISLGMFSAFSMVLGLTGTVLITRHFSVEDYGAYILITVISSFLSQFSTMGLEFGITKFVAGAQDLAERERFFNTAAVVRIGSILLMGLFALVGNPLLEMLFGKSMLPGFIIYAPLLFAIDSFRAMLKSSLQGCLLFQKIGIIHALESVVFLLYVLTIYLTDGDITMLIIARILTSALAGVLTFVLVPIRKTFSVDMPILKQLLKFGLPLQINDMLGFIFGRIDTVAVAMFLGPAEIATYEVARKIPEYLRSFYEPYRSVYFPTIAKRYTLDGQEKANQFLNDSVRFVAFVTLLGVVVSILFGREILQLVFSEKYAPAAPAFVILMINLSIALTSNIMGTTLVAIGETNKPAIINFFNAVASWLGTLALIPPLALVGASIANTVGTVVAMPINRYFLRRKMQLQDVTYLKPAALVGVWGLLIFAFKPETFWLKAIFLVGFVVQSFLLSIITWKDFVLLAEGLRLNSWAPIKKLTNWISRP